MKVSQTIFMKRYTLYLFIALLTFGIGSYFALKLLWTSNLQTSATPQFLSSLSKKSDYKTTFPKLFDSSKNKEKPTKPFCNDQNILPIWKVLLKDKTFNYYIEGLNEVFDCKEVLDIKEINLNDDSQKEIIVSGQTSILCGGTGNCGFWIFEINNGKMQKLLSNTNYLDSLVSVQKTRTNGYSNILLKGHISGYETSFTKYKFNGQKYVETKCTVEAFHLNDEREVLTCKEWQRQANENSKAMKKDFP